MANDPLLIGGGAGLAVGVGVGTTGLLLHRAGVDNPTPDEITQLKTRMDAAAASYTKSLSPAERLPSDNAAVRAARELLDRPVRVIASNNEYQNIRLTELVDDTVFSSADAAAQHGWAHNEGQAIGVLQPGKGQFLAARADDELAPFHDWHWENRSVSWTTTRTEQYTDSQGKRQTRQVTDHHSATAQVRQDTVERYRRFVPPKKEIVGIVRPDLHELDSLGTSEQQSLRRSLERATGAYDDAVADVARAPGQLKTARVLMPAGLVIAGAGALALAYAGVRELSS